MRQERNIKLIAFGILLLVATTFGIYKSRDLIFGNTIELTSPKNGATLNEGYIVVAGRAPGTAMLTIGGAKVLTDKEGNFAKELILGVGYNRIVVSALDRWNRETHKVIEVVYKATEGNKPVAFISR
jgi:ABC-type uncharacterized transport system permease subunit